MVERTEQAKRQRLSELLISLMESKNWSTNELAKNLDVATPTARTYVQATGYPGEQNRKKIARLLGITFEELQAALDDEPLAKKQNSVEFACQLARSLPLKDFVQLAQVVNDRQNQELGVIVELQVGHDR